MVHVRTLGHVWLAMGLALTGSNCGKPADSSKQPAPPAPAPAAPAAPPAPLAKLDGAQLKVTRCALGITANVFHLTVDPHGTISILDDKGNVHRTKPGSGPCGLVAGDVVAGPVTLDAQLGFVTAPTGDAGSDGLACQSDGVALGVISSERPTYLAFLGGNRALVYDHDHLSLEDRGQKPCKRSPFTTTVPDGIGSVTVGPSAVFIQRYHRSPDSDGVDTSVWRYKLDGTLIDKTFGQGAASIQVGGQSGDDLIQPDVRMLENVVPCGPGACATGGGATKTGLTFAIFDASGKPLAVHKLKKTQAALQAFNVTPTPADIAAGQFKGVDGPDSEDFNVRRLITVDAAVYGVISEPAAGEAWVQDLVRIDGVFAR